MAKKKKEKKQKSMSSGRLKAMEQKAQKEKEKEASKKIKELELKFEEEHLDIKISKVSEKNSNKSYIEANSPYNFIDFSEKIFERYKSCNDVVKFDKFDKNLNTGYIDYTFVNETPLFISDSKKKDKLFINAQEDYCIPGSTMRGVFRSNTEILGFGYPEFIEDRTYLYRSFKSDSSANEYRKIIDSKKSNVKVGYIYKKNSSEYMLCPAKKICGKDWYEISEKKLMEALEGDSKDINFMYDESLLETEIKNAKAWNSYCKEHKPESYEPYLQEVFFEVENKKIVKICTEEFEGFTGEGIIFNTNYVQGKSKHYIIGKPEDFNKNSMPIDSKIILDYKADYEANNQMSNKDFYLLPEDEGKEYAKYFFYKSENNDIKYIGKSPFMRIFYNQSVRDCISLNIIEGIDYPSAIYGYTDDENQRYSLKRGHNYKGRVSFMDAKINGTKIISTEFMSVILSSPKASCYKLYLKQENISDEKDIMTYNYKVKDDDTILKSRLRGRKFYWNKEFDKREIKLINDKNENENIKVKMNEFYDVGNEFTGRIYFENLTDDELGILLLSIKLKSDCKENIGMGKPYGMGRIDIQKVNLYLENIDRKFTSFNTSYLQGDSNKYKLSYLNYINENFVSKNFDKNYCELPIIRDFYKSKKFIGSGSKFSYSSLEDFDKFIILPKVEEIE